MKSKLILTLAAVTLAASAYAFPITGSVLLTPGSTVFPGLIAPGTNPGTLLATLVVPYSFTTTAGTTSGTLSTAVYQELTGMLDFYYQVSNNANSASAIARLSAVDFDSFLTSVGYRTDGASLLAAPFVNGTVAPVTADRGADGSVVGFNFNPPDSAKILAGTTSFVVVISTNATAYTNGNMSVIDGGSQTVAAFQPTGSRVPDAGSAMSLLGLGLMAVEGLRRKLKKA